MFLSGDGEGNVAPFPWPNLVNILIETENLNRHNFGDSKASSGSTNADDFIGLFSCVVDLYNLIILKSQYSVRSHFEVIVYCEPLKLKLRSHFISYYFSWPVVYVSNRDWVVDNRTSKSNTGWLGVFTFFYCL